MKIITGQLKGGLTAPAPSIECWIPEGNHTGIGMVVLAGGGYGGLAEHEGAGYAEHFMKAGVACFVVTYRLGSQGLPTGSDLKGFGTRRCWKTRLPPLLRSVPVPTNMVWIRIDWES
jgi:hypothetical protein